MMNWYLDCAYNPEQKCRFHGTARACLRKLAEALDFAPDTYDLRNNEAGIAVSGEITLHHERIYIQISQPFLGYDTGILIRCCTGRRDYTGGRNHFAPLSLLDDIPALARRVTAVMAASGACVAASERKRAAGKR